MVSAIDNYNYHNTQKLNEDFYNAQVEATKILGEYERLLHIFEERKSGKKEVVKQDILKIENDLRNCYLLQEDFSKQKNKLEEEMSDLRIWFVQHEINLDIYSLATVKEWEKLQEEKRKNYIELRDSLQSQKEILSDSIKTIKESIKSVMKRKESFLEDPQMFTSIMILKEKPENYDFYKELEALWVLKEFTAKDKKIAAICAAPMILGELGLLKGKRATCYPDMESEIEDAYLTGAPVATDENIITSQGVGTAIDFALKLIEVLISEEKAVEIADSIVYQR